MISIIIPLYNQADRIGKCLKAIFNQTIDNFEVIVVNDGSTDDFQKALVPWQDRIKLFNQRNQGAPVARNFGFSQSVGEYIIFCDADVIMQSGMLEKMLQVLENNRSVAYAYCSFRFGWKKFGLWPFSVERLRSMPYIHSTSLIRREMFPGWDESLKKFQDWDLWLTILTRGGKGKWIDEVLFQTSAGGTMSSWLPKWLYCLIWLKRVKKYQIAKKIITDKHNLIT